MSDDAVTFTLDESGPLTVWSEHGPPVAEGIAFESLGNGLYHADLKIEAGERQITLTR